MLARFGFKAPSVRRMIGGWWVLTSLMFCGTSMFEASREHWIWGDSKLEIREVSTTIIGLHLEIESYDKDQDTGISFCL